MKKLLATTALLALLVSPAYAGGEGHYFHPKHKHHTKVKTPTGTSGSQGAPAYLYFLGECFLASHFVDTFIRERGQYKNGTYVGHQKRTHGDQAAVIGNCLFPIVGGMIARKMTGKDENKPLAFYTDDSWMFLKN